MLQVRHETMKSSDGKTNTDHKFLIVISKEPMNQHSPDGSNETGSEGPIRKT